MQQNPCVLQWSPSFCSSPAAEPLHSPKELPLHPDPAAFPCEGMTVGIQNTLRKAVALGDSWLVLPFMAQTFQKSTFVEKIFLIALFATT